MEKTTIHSLIFVFFSYSGANDDVIRLEEGTGVSITNSVFTKNEGDSGAINAALASQNTIIESCTFFDNVLPLMINLSIDLDASNVFHSPSRTIYNDINAVYVQENETPGNAVWSQKQIPYVFLDDQYNISGGSSLHLAAGTILKFSANSSWIVNGILSANGSQAEPIYFTSYLDDSAGGDTNNDGNSTTPAVGDWHYLKFEGLNNSSQLNYVVFRYGGGSAYDDYTVHLGTNTALNIQNCSFYFNNGLDDCVLDAKNAGNGTILRYNLFYSNEKPLAINGSISLDESNVFVNYNSPNLETNTFNGVFVKAGSNIIGNVSWQETQVPFVLSGQTVIASGNSLTLSSNVILKFMDGSLYYNGNNLIGYDYSGVWFTSYHDDNLGGDTNGNGSSTIPNTGDWQGINNQTGWEDWDNILYSAN